VTVTLGPDRKTDLLASVAMFAGLGPEGLAMVAEQAVEVDFAAGRTIVRQGDVGTGFFLIVSGGARVVRDATTIAELGPGDFFGELSLLDGEPRMAAVVAGPATTCLALATWQFESLLESQPRLAIAILRGVARRLRAVSEEHRH
jgi:CRP-like cAMP-binding protein